MKKWKAITFDYLDLLNYDNSTIVPVCLTQRQVAILKALLVTAYWQTRWQNLTISVDELEASIAEIDYRLDGNNCSGGGGDMPVDFRDKPGNPCVVQYSNDGGLTWLDGWQKDGCVSYPGGGMSISIVNESNTTIENNNTTYAGDIINIAPQWTYNGIPGDDSLSNKALCWAIQKHVDWVCDTRARQIREGNEHLKEVVDFAQDATDPINAVAVSIALVASGPGAALVAATAWAAGKIWTQVIAAWLMDDPTLFEDESARETVACWMYRNMQNQTPQFPVWQSSLSNFGGGETSESAIAAIVNEVNQDADIYVNYLTMVENINQVADSLPACPCPDVWEHEWNFADYGMEAWQIEIAGEYSEPVGELVPGVGIEGRVTNFRNGTRCSNMIHLLTLRETIPNCTGFSVDWQVTKGGIDPFYIMMGVQVSPGLNESVESRFILSTDYVVDWSRNFAVADCQDVTWWVRTQYGGTCPPPEPGYVKVVSIRLRGIGVDPFRGRVTASRHEP